MGMHDREFRRLAGEGSTRLLVPRTAVGWLVLVNVVVFLFQHLLKVGLAGADHPEIPAGRPLGGFSIEGLASEEGPRWWTIVTHQFVHAGVAHLFFNLVFLWIAGRPLQMLFGNGAVLLVYLVSGLSGLILHFVANELPLIVHNPWEEVSGDLSYLVGASGAASGFVCAIGLARPFHDLIEPFRLVLPLRLGALNLAIGIVLVTGLFIFVDWVRGLKGVGQVLPIAHHVHLGGAAAGALTGWLLARRQRALFASRRPVHRRSLPPRERIAAQRELFENLEGLEGENKSAGPKSATPREQQEDETREEFVKRRIDPILDKISEHGYASLSDEEKGILEEGRKRL